MWRSERRTSRQRHVTFERLRSTANFRFVLGPEVVKISGRSRSLSHFRRIASADWRHLTDDALATRRRRPKPRESSGNRCFFSHEPPSVPHTNGKRHRAASSRNSHSRSTPTNPTIQLERFARAGRSFRRNHLSSSPKKTVDRILSGILITNWRIAQWWNTAACLAGRVSNLEKLTR